MMVQWYQTVFSAFEKWLTPFAFLGLRLQVANVFLSSGLTKWHGFLEFNTAKYDLFLYEFFCPDPIRPGALLLCDAQTLEYDYDSFIVSFIEVLAVSAGVIEVVLPVLLIVGLFSRFAALGLIGMTLFIQLAIFPDWAHWQNPASWWFFSLLIIMVSGPSWFSLDRWFGIEKRTT